MSPDGQLPSSRPRLHVNPQQYAAQFNPHHLPLRIPAIAILPAKLEVQMGIVDAGSSTITLQGSTRRNWDLRFTS